MLFTILIPLLISIIAVSTSIFNVNVSQYIPVKSQRQELYSWVNNWDITKQIIKKRTDNNINYINNQISRDSIFSFDIVSTGYAEYKLRLDDYSDFTSPKLYVFVYKNGSVDSILDNVKAWLRERWMEGVFDLWDTLDLDNAENGLYKLDPDSNDEITIKWNDLNYSLQFFFINNDWKWVIWELFKSNLSDDAAIKNIIRQTTKIRKEEIENYFQANGLNWITILNN